MCGLIKVLELDPCVGPGRRECVIGTRIATVFLLDDFAPATGLIFRFANRRTVSHTYPHFQWTWPGKSAGEPSEREYTLLSMFAGD